MDDTDLVVSFDGSISHLRAQGELRLAPPAPDSISGIVTVELDGNIDLGRRPGEAFKLVALSSMHVSADQWDVRSVQVDSQSFSIPTNGWIIHPPAVGRLLGLRGGSSAWKANAPTLEVQLTEKRAVTGWVTATTDHNDDNVSLWATGDNVIRSWEYRVTAKR
jgi:hypothetical protein